MPENELCFSCRIVEVIPSIAVSMPAEETGGVGGVTAEAAWAAVVKVKRQSAASKMVQRRIVLVMSCSSRILPRG